MAEPTSEQLAKLAIKFKEMLAENDAELFDQLPSTYASLVGDAELPRHWPELSPDDLPQACDYLNAVTSVKNKEPCKYVDDPQAGREIFAGRWRQAFLRRITQGDVTKLVQILRKGYAETIKWDEARIRTRRKWQDQPTGDNPSDEEKYLDVYWPNCSISKLEAMAASLSERTYTDPVIEEETRTGEWRNIGVSVEKADDGSGVVTMHLAISHFRLDSYFDSLTHRSGNVVYLWGYGKDEAQSVIDAWKAKGRSATVSYRSATDGLVDIVLRERDYDSLTISSSTSAWDCRYKEISDYYFGVEDPELYPLDTEPANGISYRRQLRDNGDGSWDIIIITTYVQYRDITYQVTEISGAAEVQTRQQLGVTTETPEPMVSTAGIIKAQRVSVRDDCSKDIVTEKDAGIEQTATIKTASPSEVATVISKTVQETELPDPVSEAGYIRRVENRDSRYPERFDTVEEERQPVNQTETGESHSSAADATEEINTEMAKVDYAAMDKTAVLGTIRDIDAIPTEAGNVRVRDSVVTPLNQTITDKEESGARSVVREIHTEAAVALPDPVETQGEINHVVNQETEAGNIRTTEEKITVKDQTSTSYEESGARSVERELHTENTAEETVVLETGKIKRADNAPTEAGNFRTVVEVVTPVDQVATGGEDSLARSIEAVLHTENTAEPDYTAAAGTIKRVTSTPTEADNFRTVEETITPKQRTVTEGSADAFKISSVTLKTQESAEEAKPVANVEGQIIVVRNEPTETGFRTEKTEISSTARSVSFTSAVTDRYDETVEKYRNADAIPDATAVANASVQIDGAMNDFQKYDYTKVVRTAHSPTSAGTISWVEYSLWRWENVVTYYSGEVSERSYTSALRQYRKVDTHTITFHLTGEAAAAAINGGIEGSSISMAGDNLWQAHKVTYDWEYGSIISFAAPATYADAVSPTRQVWKKA